MTGSEILVVIIVAGVLIGVWIFLQQKAKTRLQQIEQETGSQTVLYKDRSANFFGQAWRGYKQVRGNGVLLITREQIMFHMWVPERN
ncbi:MAG: hypothetical protein U5R06_15320 [candidate division KSB1 bacterium]|nr:hypothetical protein [candidate division KSB1 bacterium]